MQVAEPMELYHRPNHRFVAGFIGSPPMNLFAGRIERRGSDWMFLEDPAAGGPEPLTLRLTEELGRMAEGRIGQPVVLGIRPEDVHEAGGPTARAAEGHGSAGDGGSTRDPAGREVVTMQLELAETMGAETYLHGATATGALIARVRSAGRHELGGEVRLALDLRRAHLFDGATGAALGHAAG
jgi:multiple sugar transport system ATP-binding protein